MKYVDEFRESSLVKKWAAALHQITTSPWTIMEVCGGQTHAIVKFGLQDLLPEQIRLIHGPGCPVCVTPIEIIDHALYIASLPNVILCSYGDMLRVPGTQTNLLTLKAKGADVRIVYSPLEAVEIAALNPTKEVIFFAVGFETTAAPNALSAYLAKKRGLHNFSLLASHVLVPPALEYLLQSADNQVQGFLAAGHVCTITGYSGYHRLSSQYRVPIVVTGFEPLDILQGIYFCVKMLENNEAAVVNQYQRCVSEQGNQTAQEIVDRVFKVVERPWRGIGTIESSGLGLQEAYADLDASLRFPMKECSLVEENGCISGLVLLGKKKPSQCPLFGNKCTPEMPLGAPMVSNEGACAAYYHYKELI
ncbi:MAG: hydrogenase formation protein HypD [Verrucomicrobia bacterium]|nr:hydrogenase formation protein HypD [Verrucomicrobiota bacterium]